MIVFLYECCKMKNAHRIVAILVKCGKLGHLGEVAQVARYNFVAQHVSLKPKEKIYWENNAKKYKNNRV